MIGKLATRKDFNNICLVEDFDCLQIKDKFVTSTKEVFECLPFFTFQSWADTLLILLSLLRQIWIQI